jgi:phosphohistidine phosphatase
MKRLILMRHGDAPNVKEVDRYRILSEKGAEQSKKAGLYLKEKSFIPDSIFYSPVQRTEKTADYVVRSLMTSPLGIQPEMVPKSALYQASKEKILYVIEECRHSVSSLLIIAHNPGITELARFLPVQKNASTSFLKNFIFPEAGILTFDYDIEDWSLLSVTEGIFLERWQYSQHPIT